MAILDLRDPRHRLAGGRFFVLLDLGAHGRAHLVGFGTGGLTNLLGVGEPGLSDAGRLLLGQVSDSGRLCGMARDLGLGVANAGCRGVLERADSFVSRCRPQRDLGVRCGHAIGDLGFDLSFARGQPLRGQGVGIAQAPLDLGRDRDLALGAGLVDDVVGASSGLVDEPSRLSLGARGSGSRQVGRVLLG